MEAKTIVTGVFALGAILGALTLVLAMVHRIIDDKAKQLKPVIMERGTQRVNEEWVRLDQWRLRVFSVGISMMYLSLLLLVMGAAGIAIGLVEGW